MKGIGKKINVMAKEDAFFQMETFIQENGKMIKLMDWEGFSIMMEENT